MPGKSSKPGRRALATGTGSGAQTRATVEVLGFALLNPTYTSQHVRRQARWLTISLLLGLAAASIAMGVLQATSYSSNSTEKRNGFTAAAPLDWPAAQGQAVRGSRAGRGSSSPGSARTPTSVTINEIAWAGTLAYSTHEWVELRNNTSVTISLAGWHLVAADGAPAIALDGYIPPQGYFLLARTNYTNVVDVPADMIYSSALEDTGEALTLTNQLGAVIDTANADGGNWPAGTGGTGTPPRASMERINVLGPDVSENWISNNGIERNGHDVQGNPINGTPKAYNSASPLPADLVIAKNGPPTVTAGCEVTYTIALSNTGLVSASNVLITDKLPPNLAYVRSSAPYSLSQPATNTLVWAVGWLPTNTLHTFTLVGLASLQAAGQLTNQVTITSSTYEIATANNSATAVTLVPTPLAELAIAKSGPPSPLYAGQPITFTIAFSNAGQVTASHTLVTDTLPASITYLRSSAPYSLSQPSSTTLAWNIGELSPSSPPISFTLTGLALAVGTHTNTVAIATTSGESTLLDNQAAFAVTIAPPPTADVAIVKSAPPIAMAGSTLTYSLSFSNTGNLAASNVIVTDTLPEWVSFTQQSSSYTFTQDGRSLAWHVGQLLTTSSAITVTITGLVDENAAGDMVNQAVITTTSPDERTSNNYASISTTVVQAVHPLDIVINEIAWSGTAASPADEWIELKNNTSHPIDLAGWRVQAYTGTLDIALSGVISANGYYLLERGNDDTISDIGANWAGSFGTGLSNDGDLLTLSDELGNAIDTANDDGGEWPAGTPGSGIPPHASMERVKPSAAGSDANWASNDGITRNGLDANGDPINGTPGQANSSTSADVGIAKSANVGWVERSETQHKAQRMQECWVSCPALNPTYEKPLTTVLHPPGNVTRTSNVQPTTQVILITYSLVFSNAGPLDAAGVVITDTLPPSLTFLYQSSAYPFTQTQDGQALVWHIGALPVCSGSLGLAFTTQVDIGFSGWLTNLASLASSYPDRQPGNNSAECATHIAAPAADIRIAKHAPLSVTAGAELTWTITLSNAGPQPASALRVTDSLPASAAFVRHSAPYSFTQYGQALVWEIGDLPAASPPISWTLTARVDSGAAGQLTNTIQVHTPSPEITLANNTAQAATLVNPLPARLLIAGVLYDGYQYNDEDEAIEIVNLGPGPINLAGWRVAKGTSSGAALPSYRLGPSGRAWAARDAEAFYASFGFWPQFAAANAPSNTLALDDTWPRLGNSSGDVQVKNPAGQVIDRMLYMTDSPVSGWQGPGVYPYPIGAVEGQILARIPDERSGLPISDTNTAADWIQYTGSYTAGRRVLYPGWDMDPLFWPFTLTGAHFDERRMTNDEPPYRQPTLGRGGPACPPEAHPWARPYHDPGELPSQAAIASNKQRVTSNQQPAAIRLRTSPLTIAPRYLPSLSPLTLTLGIAPDNAYVIVRDALRQAAHSIEIETYSLAHWGLVNELVEKASAGVSVSVLLEGEPIGGIEDQELWACQQIEHAGGQCWFMHDYHPTGYSIYDRYDLVHSKFIIVDGQRLVVSTQNLSPGGLPDDDKADGTYGSRGYVLVVDSPQLAARAGLIFDLDLDPTHADIARWPNELFGFGQPSLGFVPITSSGGTTTTVYFPSPQTFSDATSFELFTAPEAALRTSDALLGLLARAGAGDEVYVEQLYEHPAWGTAPNPRLQAYVDAARRGARVRILLNSGSFDADYIDLSNNLAAVASINALAHQEGLDLQAHVGNPTRYGIHSKLVLVKLATEHYTHIGSLNGSEASHKVNRELVLQVESAALYDALARVFWLDWYLSLPIYLPLVVSAYPPPPPPPPVDYVVISEVLYDPYGLDTGLEWVELYNPTDRAIDLSSWSLGDAVIDGEYGSGRYLFPAGTLLEPGGVIVVAQQAADTVPLVPDFEFLIDPNRDDPTVPNMIPAGSWSGFGVALGNEGDEVILRDGGGAIVDALVWGLGNYKDAGVLLPHPGVLTPAHSLERRPAQYDTDDCSTDFIDRYPPQPGQIATEDSDGR